MAVFNLVMVGTTPAEQSGCPDEEQAYNYPNHEFSGRRPNGLGSKKKGPP